ncbi:MAG TPA: chemotaxis-specific protein-glutamate methyltransferase CheB [Desulfuromonadales bacterium]|nr:chemotaxis-specific protein-glutamate methyltransferase CheB [Desulfuromonadales bacterium]
MAKTGGTIRVLVVDDSGLIREMIRDILESDPGIVVVGEATNGMEAIAKVASLKPDIVTMDIEMPVMGGLEAIEKIIAKNPVPILVVTALTGVRTAFTAVSKGALDVIEKPDISVENVRNLIKKIRLLSKVDVTSHLMSMRRVSGEGVRRDMAVKRTPAAAGGIVAIAASTGGPQAIHTILMQLPAHFPVPIVITQHIAEGFTQGMVDWLNMGTPLTIHVAVNGDRVQAGHVYINPAENSMKISEQGVIVLGDRDARQIYHPSCNTMLTSVAAAYHKGAIGLIMSGMGDDGVSGIHAIRTAGGTTLAQDAKSSVVYGMNRLAIERGHIQKVVQLADIPAELAYQAGIR